MDDLLFPEGLMPYDTPIAEDDAPSESPSQEDLETLALEDSDFVPYEETQDPVPAAEASGFSAPLIVAAFSAQPGEETAGEDVFKFKDDSESAEQNAGQDKAADSAKEDVSDSAPEGDVGPAATSTVEEPEVVEPEVPPLQSWTATVTSIVDGDTFYVEWALGDEPPEGLTNRIRISGVDTNETSYDEPFAHEAKARLAELLPIGSEIRLEARDIESAANFRPLRHVFIGDVNVALVLIEEGLGLAVSYDAEPDYRDEYFAASERAQLAEVGMWAPGAAGGDPSTWPDIDVVVNYDAQGADGNNLNDEYVQIRNNGPEDLDLSNWTFRSSARLEGATIVFPFNTILEPGDVYRIHVGYGLDTANESYLRLSEPMFDNEGDVVYIRDQFLNVRATQLWPATLTRGEEASIVIDEVQFDAPGIDGENPNGEWIKIRNAGAEAVDLTDWRIKEEGEDYRFADGEILEAGESLKIFIGEGTDAGSERYWGLDRAILNNEGGELNIWTPQSLEVDAFTWGDCTRENENPRGAIRLSVNFDEVGEDGTNPNGEWVALRNTSDSAIDIGGYQLRSGDDVYTFAEGTLLEADANMIVRVGIGTDTDTTKFWGNETGIFANTGDSVDLVNTEDDIILHHEVPSPNADLADYGLVIEAVNHDPAGNDDDNPNGEWIIIRNSSAAEQNLINWKVTVGEHHLTLLENTIIPSGGTLTIYMGQGTNTESEIYWGNDTAILDNDGNTAVQLLTPVRQMTQSHSWGSGGAGAEQSVSAAIDLSVNYDAEGNDELNPNGEWVNLVNTSSSAISLDGYHLYTDGTRYDFDADDILQAGERMRVYAGTGTDSGLERYGNLNAFANGGDEVELRSNETYGAVATFSYAGSPPEEPPVEPNASRLTNGGSFEISDVNYNAPGADSENANGEWIEITNTGSNTADLRDWRMQYNAGTFYDFNDSVMIDAGATIRIYSGIGTDTATEFYWGNDGGILSNTAGTLTLQSNYREEHDTYAWPSLEAGNDTRSIVIDTVQFDAPGVDAENPNGEWIVIRNAGDSTVDLTGWRLTESSAEYRFNDGETLAAGEQLKLFIGSGTDSGSDRYWGLSEGTLSNTGEELNIITPSQYAVDSYSWGDALSENEDPRGAITLSVNYDAEGKDSTNPNGEWVALHNTSDSAIDIGGFQLVSGSDVYTFADGTMLAADANMIVRVGTGTDSVLEKFWGNDSAIFANGSDSVGLVNTDNDTILHHAWPAPSESLADTGLVIEAVNYDPAGNDNNDPNGEWIIIRNSSAAEQNLINMKLTVGGEHLNFLESTRIAAGETLTIYMGQGTNTESEIYWGNDGAMLANNGRDAVQLLSAGREVVQSHSWGSGGAGAEQSVPAAIDLSVNYDAEGNDELNPNGEWINLVNTSSSAISLDGYHLFTDGTRYDFDADDILQAGERMRVYMGTGTDSGLERYGNLNALANGGDGVALRDNDTCGVVSEFSYSGNPPEEPPVEPNASRLTNGGSFEITDVNYNAVGTDSTNPNGEWIEITNTGSNTADLRDWRIQYNSGTFYDFNVSLEVAAGEAIRIYSGIGTDTDSALYWGNTSGILNNSEGSVTLQTNYRETEDAFVWPATEPGVDTRSIVIVDVQFDAPGVDAENPNGEWIVIRNSGDTTVDLTDWRLQESSHEYRFADGDSLAAGAELKLFIGSGTDSGSDRYWGLSEGTLSNTGEELNIITPSQYAVDSYSWGDALSENEDPRGAINLSVNYDAEGRDSTNPNGEWVALHNTSDSAIDISGFQLVSGSDVYTFADGTMLAADANMIVRVGTGTDSDLEKFWGNDSAIFANGGDSVGLVNTDNDTILHHAWPAPSESLADTGLVIEAVNYNPAGNDNDYFNGTFTETNNPNGEWIILRNTSAADQNLVNWQLKVGGEQLNFLESTRIAAGETLTIYMGQGTNTETEFYWGSNTAMLDNDGSDAVQLLSAEREVVQSHSWGTGGSGAEQSVSAAIDISVNYDAEGTDDANPNGEWINLHNTSSSAISLDGYHLFTDGTRYDFDADDILQAGERLRVYMGTGTDSGLERYGNLNSLANSGDSVALRANESMSVVSEFAYSGNPPEDPPVVPNPSRLSSEAAFEISDVQYNAPGSDATNPNGEWINISNVGSEAADLRDWMIQYKSGHYYDFKDSLVLGVGETITLYIGSGINTATELYWGKDGGILNNTSGSLTLQSKYREEHDTYVWPVVS